MLGPTERGFGNVLMKSLRREGARKSLNLLMWQILSGSQVTGVATGRKKLETNLNLNRKESKFKHPKLIREIKARPIKNEPIKYAEDYQLQEPTQFG